MQEYEESYGPYPKPTDRPAKAVPADKRPVPFFLVIGWTLPAFLAYAITALLFGGITESVHPSSDVTGSLLILAVQVWLVNVAFECTTRAVLQTEYPEKGFIYWVRGAKYPTVSRYLIAALALPALVVIVLFSNLLCVLLLISIAAAHTVTTVRRLLRFYAKGS